MVQPLLDRPGTSTHAERRSIPNDHPRRPVMAPDDESSLGVLAHRVGAVEEGIRELRADIRGGFAGLSFVGKDVYASEQKAAREFAEETRRIAEHGRTVSMATLTFVIVAIGAMLALIKAVGG